MTVFKLELIARLCFLYFLSALLAGIQHSALSLVPLVFL